MATATATVIHWSTIVRQAKQKAQYLRTDVASEVRDEAVSKCRSVNNHVEIRLDSREHWTPQIRSEIEAEVATARDDRMQRCTLTVR